MTITRLRSEETPQRSGLSWGTPVSRPVAPPLVHCAQMRSGAEACGRRRLVECRSQWPRLQVDDVGVSGNTASSRYLAW